MFMAICPVCRDATKAVPPKSKGGRLFDFTLLCCKSHKSSDKSSDVFSILNHLNHSNLYLHFFLDSSPKMRGFVSFVPPQNRPNMAGTCCGSSRRIQRLVRHLAPVLTNGASGTRASWPGLRCRQSGMWSAPNVVVELLEKNDPYDLNWIV